MEINLNVNGMHCEHCEKRVEDAVKEINGVKNAKADHINCTLVLDCDDSVNVKDIKKTIKKIGFKVK